MTSGATFTRDELLAHGFEVRDGRAVRIAPPVHVVPSPEKRAWPVMQFELPRPRSKASERNEQNEICKLFRTAGCMPKSTSQFRKSKQALGMPDLWVFGPPGSAKAWWFEVKSGETWEFSPWQLTWALDCYRANTVYGCGDRWSARVFLKALGIQWEE